MKLFKTLGILALCGVASVACSDNGSTVSPGDGNDFPVNEPVEFVSAKLIYLGQGGLTNACVFDLTLYTDMEFDESGNPIGPGKLLHLDFNATPFGEGETNFIIPAGRYKSADTSYLYDPFTFNWGYMRWRDTPKGTVEVPEYTYFGELAEGETAVTPDLINYGAFEVSVADDGTYTIVGCVVGCGSNATCRKHNFTFTGKMEAEDLSNYVAASADTTLDSDIELRGFTRARLKDLGDLYFIQDNSYRAFDLLLSDSAEADFGLEWPTVGRMLRVTFIVPFDADVNNGVPAGEYVMMTDNGDGGVERKEIVPYKLRPGVPGKYTKPNGTWYLSYYNDTLVEYGRISSGKVTVERSGDAHKFTMDFLDCAQTPHRVTCRYMQTEPIELFVRNY